ncbi:transposase [Mesorhizobium sp. M1365]|uniref:transposase n=1 Tax=Mesorhizobium sp. M1365 TaxID=2957090 RepID=UPI00333A14A5
MITSVERRRRWSREEKERLVAACLEPNASVSEIAARRASWQSLARIPASRNGRSTGRARSRASR